MTDILLRDAEAGDLPEITEIYADAVLNGTASYELEPPTGEEMRTRFDRLTVRGLPWLVADADGRIAGYAYAGPFRERPAYRFIVEDSVYIHPDFKGRGIGRMLLRDLIDACERRGFRQLVAVIGDGTNHPASVRLHEGLGFVHSGTLAGSGFKHGRWLDTVIMQLALNGGIATLPE